MRKLKKRWLSALLTAITIICLFQTTAFAASTRKCYTISSNNTTVYSNTGLTTRYGSIYGSDEITVLDVTSRYCRVNYPISGGRTKTGYIPTSAILRGTSGSSYKSRGKVTTYKRPGGGTYGYVSKGDTVTVLGTYGNYTQLKYPVSGGYKYAFVTTSDYNNYIKPNNNNNTNQSSSSWQMPMQNAYVCGNNWLTYYSARPSRPYHLGLDLASRNGSHPPPQPERKDRLFLLLSSEQGKYYSIKRKKCIKRPEDRSFWKYRICLQRQTPSLCNHRCPLLRWRILWIRNCKVRQ